VRLKLLIAAWLLSTFLSAGKVGLLTKSYKVFLRSFSHTLVKNVYRRTAEQAVSFQRKSVDIATRLRKKYASSSKKTVPSHTSTSLSIASWNLHNFSPNASETKRRAVNSYLKQLFYYQATDIVFLQELRDSNGISALHTSLTTYGYFSFISEPLGQSVHKERLAVLIHPLLLAKLAKNNTPPLIKTLPIHRTFCFKRPPFGIVIGKRLLILNVHLGHYGNDVRARQRRREEARCLKQLALRLMRRYRTQHLIIGGDFNLDAPTLRAIFTPVGTLRFFVSTDRPTTAKNSFDHIISTLPLRSDIVSRSSHGSVGDHRPVRVSVHLKNPATKKRKR